MADDDAPAKKQKQDLVQLLNEWYSDNSTSDVVDSNAVDILAKAVIADLDLTVLGHVRCRITTLSVDSRGSAQRDIRHPSNWKKKSHFRPWHVVWISHHKQSAPLGLQYSHRCNQQNCVEPTHGVWEEDQRNKDRWSCREVSHLILTFADLTIPRKVIRICPHTPCCLVPLFIPEDSPRFVNVQPGTPL